MFYSAHDDVTMSKVATGPIVDYDTARDILQANDGTRVYAYMERVESPYIVRFNDAVHMSDLAPAVGFAWIGAGSVPVARA